MSHDADSSSTSGGTLEPIWLGVGSARPQPRLLQNAMFGHVADAFDEKSIFKIGQTPPHDKRAQTTTTTTTQADDQTTTTNTTTTTTATTTTTTTTSTDGTGVVDGGERGVEGRSPSKKKTSSNTETASHCTTVVRCYLRYTRISLCYFCFR